MRWIKSLQAIRQPSRPDTPARGAASLTASPRAVPSASSSLMRLSCRPLTRACPAPCNSGITIMKFARLSSIAPLLAGSVLAASPAAATVALSSDPDPITGQIGIASQYVGKGLGKSDEDPAAFASVRWQPNDFYVNAFVSQVSTSRGADAEVILSAGYTRELGDWDVDVVVMHRQLLNETNGVDSSYVEFQGDLSRALTNRISARFRVNYSADAYGATEEAWWTEAQATFKLTSNDKLSVAYGLRRVDGGNDYDAWNVGVKHKFTPAISGDLRWYDTDSHELGSRYDGRLVASISYSF